MLDWSLLFGGLAYILVGKLMNCVTMGYLQKLTDKVMAVYGDERYARMLWYRVPVVNTRLNQLLVEVIFTVFWPIICVAAILKAEWNYDKVMHRNAFRREVP